MTKGITIDLIPDDEQLLGDVLYSDAFLFLYSQINDKDKKGPERKRSAYIFSPHPHL